jgi:hypothetical protein
MPSSRWSARNSLLGRTRLVHRPAFVGGRPRAAAALDAAHDAGQVGELDAVDRRASVADLYSDRLTRAGLRPRSGRPD